MGIPLHFLLEQQGVVFEQMHPAGVDPMAPAGRILAQHVTRQDSIAGGILHVDVEVGAEHGNDYVQVDLQVVRHAFFDREQLRFMATVPSAEFGEGEIGGDDEEEERGVAPGGAPSGIGGFSLC